MQPLIDHLKAWQLHPFVDHFTVAILVIAVLADLAASLLSSRLWLRHMALTLLILGTLAAFGSRLTGGWEADKVWDSLSGPAKELLRWHGRIGDYLPFAFGVLVLWRLLVHFTVFGARSRPIYLIIALIAAGFVLYQGYLGGELVYDYGAGTALLQAAAPSPSPAAESPPPTPAMIPSSIPTVFVPPATLAPTASSTPAAAAVMPSASPQSPTEVTPTPTDDSSTKNL